MNTLSQEDIDSISSEDAIISCGIDNEILYIITSRLDVRQIKPSGRLRPTACLPTLDGSCIMLYFAGLEDPALILSTVVIENSESSLSNTSLYVNNNYMCDLDIVDLDHENNVKTSERIDQRRS